MKNKFTALVIIFSIFLFFNPIQQQKCYSRIPTESFHNIEFAFEGAALHDRFDLGLEYGYQFGFADYFSVYPYGKLNFLGVQPMIDCIDSLDWVNTWGGEGTPAYNILLLGFPYIIAGSVVLFQSQYLFDYGVDLAVHPFVSEYFDSFISIGLENSPLKYYQASNGNSQVAFFYPFLKSKLEVNGKYKLGMISVWAEYQFDIFDAAGATRNSFNCSDFNFGIGISLIPGRL